MSGVACQDCGPKQTDDSNSNGDLASTDPQLDVSASDPKSTASFAHPTKLPTHSITIEFCDRVKFACFDSCTTWLTGLAIVTLAAICVQCRWLHRATWVATELMLTFPPPALKGIHLIPLNAESTAGRFRVWLSTDNDPILVWDRKLEGRFPELKEVKQRIRDIVQPSLSLGHSDKK